MTRSRLLIMWLLANNGASVRFAGNIHTPDLGDSGVDVATPNRKAAKNTLMHNQREL